MECLEINPQWDAMGKWDSAVRMRFETQLHPLLAVRPWPNYLASLSFNAPINKTGVITPFTKSCQD